MEDITLKVDHLKAGYDGKTILNDISFDVKKGEIRMILGSSGCGKSTLMNNILKLYKSESGTITYFGKQFGAKDSPAYGRVVPERGAPFGPDRSRKRNAPADSQHALHAPKTNGSDCSRPT